MKVTHNQHISQEAIHSDPAANKHQEIKGNAIIATAEVPKKGLASMGITQVNNIARNLWKNKNWDALFEYCQNNNDKSTISTACLAYTKLLLDYKKEQDVDELDIETIDQSIGAYLVVFLGKIFCRTIGNSWNDVVMICMKGCFLIRENDFSLRSSLDMFPATQLSESVVLVSSEDKILFNQLLNK